MNFKVSLTAKNLFIFSMYHIYHQRLGISSLVLGTVTLFLAVFRWSYAPFFGKLLLIFCLFAFFLWEPLRNFINARAQAASPAFKEPITYTFTKDSIVAEQKKGKQRVPWKRVAKVVRISSLYMIYIDASHALLIPTEIVGAKRDAFETVLREQIPAGRRKGF